MNEVFALKIFTDLCYYMFAVSSLTTLAAHSGLLVTSPLIVAAAAFFCLMCARKWPQNKLARYWPMAIGLLSFIFTRTVMDVAVTVPMLAYLGVVMYLGRTDVDYDGTLAQFYLCLKLIPAPMFLTILTSNWDGFLQVMLPYFFFFLLIDVMMLRMLRHGEKVYTDRRFRLMNLLEMALLCALGYLLSSGLMLRIVSFVWSLVVRFIFRPVFMGVAYVFGGIAWLLGKVFSGISFNPEGLDLSGLDSLGSAVSDTEQSMLDYYAEQPSDTGNSNAFLYVIMAVSAVIIAVVVVLLFRAFIKAARKGRDSQFDGVRERVEEVYQSSGRRLGRSHRDRVRHVYRKFLKICYHKGVDPQENLDSRDVNERVRAVMNRSAIAGLRDVYIRARYSSGDITGDDVKAAKEALDGIYREE